MLPTPDRETFAVVHQRQKDAARAYKEERRALEKEYHEALRTSYKQKYPRRKMPELEYEFFEKGRELAKEVVNVYNPLVEALDSRHRQEKKEHEKQLRELAETTEVEVSETQWTRLRRIYESTYRSQGMGAETYARNAAEMDADRARFHGVPTEVRRVMTNRHKLVMYEVWAAVDKVNAALLKIKPGPTLKEAVRLCWKRGVNPRVYNPFLPHGYEEQNNLDYFGNEVKR